LHHGLAELEGRLTGRRHHARAERHAEGPAPRVDLARHRGHGGQVGALPAPEAPRRAPSSASAPAIFSTNTVAPVPRRPAVYSESCTATSSLITTGTTSIPSSPASSAAIWKFSTSPV